MFYCPLAGNSWSKGAKLCRGRLERDTIEGEHYKWEKKDFNAISLRLLSQKIHRDCNCTIEKLVDQKRGRGMWSGVISLTRVAVAARRLTPFRSSTAPSISRKRVSRTTRELLRPSKSAAARPLYELHVKPSMKTRPAVRQLAQSWQQFIHKYSTPPSDLGARRYIHHTMQRGAKIQPAKRVAGRRQDVWYVADPVPFLVRTTCSFPDTTPNCCDEVFVSGIHPTTSGREPPFHA